MPVLDELVVTFEADTAPLRSGLNSAVRATESAGKKMDRAFGGLAGIEKALEGISSGTRSASEAFRQFTDSLLKDLARIALKEAVIKPAGNFLSDVIGHIAGSFFSSPVTPRADGGAVAAGKTFLVGEKGPELLRMGSQAGFITPNHALGGGSVNIRIINNSSAEITARENRSSGGSRDIDILIDEALARHLRRPGSKSGRAIRETFGANPVTIGR